MAKDLFRNRAKSPSAKVFGPFLCKVFNFARKQFFQPLPRQRKILFLLLVTTDADCINHFRNQEFRPTLEL